MKKILSISAIFILTIVLFACQKETFIVSYNLDGGIGLINDEEVAKNKLATKPTIEPTKEGFDFIYWEYLGEEFDFKTPIVKNITLTAKWDHEKFPEINYLVTFDSNGGTDVDEVEVPHGFLVNKPEAPTKDHMVFIGWYLDDVEFDFQTKILGPITLVAKWEEIANPGEKFTVTIEQNNGEDNLVLYVYSGNKITEELNLVYEGYGFAGLYRDFEFENEFNLDEDVIEDNITLYVRWAEVQMDKADINNEVFRGTVNRSENFAYRLGLDNNYFDAKTTGSGNATGVYDELRIYVNSKLTITINESFVISKIVINFTNQTGTSKDPVNGGEAKITLGNNTQIINDYRSKSIEYSDLNIDKVSIETTTERIYFHSMEIYYFQVGEDVQREDDINRPEFDLGEESLIISNIGDLITHPVVKANDLEDGEIVAEVDGVKTNVNIHLIGVYYIRYFAEDEDGNIGYGYITVIIREEQTLENYYGDITSEGEVLQEELSILLNETGSFVSYAKAKDVLEISDRDPNNFNNVWLIYNSASIKGKWQHPNYAREHVWAKSQLGGKHSIFKEGDSYYDGFGKTFGESYIGAASDLQNLRAINPSVNSTHSNHRFGINSSTGEWGLVPNQPETTFFPGDEHKGDVARILLYMLLVWDINPREDISMLVNWHNLDPVDNFEIIRNEVIYSYQGNRNPFIDYPNLVEKAFLVN